MPSPFTVDAHHHFWDPASAQYPWMTGDFAPIARAFGPEDLRPNLARTGIARTVLVQTRSSLDETRDFLRIAAETDFIAGVVGWVDLTAPDVGTTLSWLRGGQGGEFLVGVRHQVHDEDDPDWLTGADVGRGLAAVSQAGLAYDLLLRAREIPAALQVVARNPELRFVVDHVAKPTIRAGWDEAWYAGFTRFREMENVAVKVSGMVTEADWHTWQAADLRPYTDKVVETFGPGRIMFGSDWPVCLLAASYERWHATARLLFENLADAERADLFGVCASRVYRLDLGESS